MPSRTTDLPAGTGTSAKLACLAADGKTGGRGQIGSRRASQEAPLLDASLAGTGQGPHRADHRHCVCHPPIKLLLGRSDHFWESGNRAFTSIPETYPEHPPPTAPPHTIQIRLLHGCAEPGGLIPPRCSLDSNQGTGRCIAPSQDHGIHGRSAGILLSPGSTEQECRLKLTLCAEFHNVPINSCETFQKQRQAWGAFRPDGGHARSVLSDSRPRNAAVAGRG